MNTDNYITSELYITKYDINKDIRIINSFENLKMEKKRKGGYEIENEIKEKCTIKINDKIIPFIYSYKFNKEGKYRIEYSFTGYLTKTFYMFYQCENLININLSNFNTQNITNMSFMFSECDSLTNINLSNFNTQNVNDMRDMFFECNSLIEKNIIIKIN